MAKKKIDEAKIEKFMKLYDLDRDGAIKMIEDDAIIDAGGKCDWEKEPTEEQKKVMRQARSTDRVIKTEKTTRTKAEDTDKKELMVALMNAVAEVADGGIVLKNPEREFEFNYHERKFKITLSAPRK